MAVKQSARITCNNHQHGEGIMKHNWQKAPSWANYAATCAFSGNREWFRSEPRSPGWVDVEARAYSGANESEWSTIVPEGYWQAAKWPDKQHVFIAHGRSSGKNQMLKNMAMAGPCKYRHEATDHSEELAEALEGVLDRICSREYDYDDFPNAGKALYKYKQSRGE